MSFSDILFERPSFTEGIARLFDWFGGLNDYNSSRTPEEADNLAMEADWQTVGNDLRNAMDHEKATTHVDHR